MATGNIGVTQVDAFIPEIWSKEIIYQTNNKSIFAGLVRRDFDGEIENSGDVVHIPLISNVTTGDKAENTAVTYTNYTESTIDITIDTHRYFAFRVEDIARIQSQPELIAGYAAQGGAQLANDIDVDIAELFKGFSNSVGTITSGAYVDITDANIRNAIQVLDESNCPEDGRVLAISPAQKNAMLGIDKFVLAGNIGDNTVIRRGLFGEIYGVKVYISNNLEDIASASAAAPAHKACAMFHREALALAMQLNPRVQAAYDLDYLATSVVGDTLYGKGELVDGFGVYIKTTDES